MATIATLTRQIEALTESVAELTEIVRRQAEQGDETLDAKEAAKLLGYASPRTIHNLVSRPEGPPFPAYRTDNGRLWFRKSELVEYLTKNRIASSGELDQLASSALR